MAANEQTTGANYKYVARVETSDEQTTMTLMRMNEGLAIVKMGGDSDGHVTVCGIGKSRKRGAVDGRVYSEVFERGYGCRENKNASDEKWMLQGDRKES